MWHGRMTGILAPDEAIPQLLLERGKNIAVLEQKIFLALCPLRINSAG